MLNTLIGIRLPKNGKATERDSKTPVSPCKLPALAFTGGGQGFCDLGTSLHHLWSKCVFSHGGTPEFGRAQCSLKSVDHTPTGDTIHSHLALEITSCTTVQSSIFVPPCNPKSVGKASARCLLGTWWRHLLADRAAATWVEGKEWQDSRLGEGSPCSICLPYSLCGLRFQAIVKDKKKVSLF